MDEESGAEEVALLLLLPHRQLLLRPRESCLQHFRSHPFYLAHVPWLHGQHGLGDPAGRRQSGDGADEITPRRLLVLLPKYFRI